ncbi:DNA adenine methylase [Synechococcus elongatus]|uniref:Site-specific DNA-methyltransferase (adenine-specific) n=1 Tax=Synechococcus elongatus PCC 11802 TaxID=2283154 RepID=A0AAT9JY74_SYNEL|nr:Dam family site-specific DNA-(adenine-N6)-methyltransferase [Synechococcus elongatus]QFZ92836.1 Dam family site-specific DNA-(adenine-N6)-methyltransferase [Synechococcus elongatus PCC 11802]
MPDPAIAPLKPPLKWAGGKRWLVPKLQELVQGLDYDRLVEPFCGGLAVTLSLQPRRALLNDINPHLINFYQQVKAGLEVTIPLENDPDLYYQYRQAFNQTDLPSALSAQYFYYLNRTGFNGLCRFNSKGEFNVPFGRYKAIHYRHDFLDYFQLFQDYQFCLGDFDQLTVMAQDLIYADPPYDVEFRQYAKEGFTWDDQVRLAHWLAVANAPVIASNQATPRILELYQSLGFQVVTCLAPRRISCNGDRQPALEMIATKGINQGWEIAFQTS